MKLLSNSSLAHLLPYFALLVILVAAGMFVGDWMQKTEDLMFQQRLEIERLSALTDIDFRYEAILESVIAKLQKYETIRLYNEKQITAISRLIYEKSILYGDWGLTPSVILSIIELESSFDPRSVSSAQAQGLMQVMRGTSISYLQDMGIPWYDDVLLDPIINIRVGVDHWMSLHRMFVAEGYETKAEFTLTSASYNWGESAVRRLMAGLEDPANLKYAMKIKSLMSDYQARGLN